MYFSVLKACLHSPIKSMLSYMLNIGIHLNILRYRILI